MKIIIDRKTCIGCGACTVLCPKFWELIEDGKSSIKGGKTDPVSGEQRLEIEDIECNKEAADACPVQCIKIGE